VPNLQGINWLIQRFASLPVLRAHVIYTTETLREVHEEAGYKTVVTKYLGFFDGFLTTSAGVSSLKRQAHYAMCRFLSLSTAVWTRAGLPTPEWRWTAPFVVYVGILPAPDRSFKEVAKNHAASMVAS
jgi:hypothetical protein